MPTLTITYDTPEERRDYERAIAFVAEMRLLGLQAPHGGVIDACEAFSLTRGATCFATPSPEPWSAGRRRRKKSKRPAATRPAARGGGRGRS